MCSFLTKLQQGDVREPGTFVILVMNYDFLHKHFPGTGFKLNDRLTL